MDSKRDTRYKTTIKIIISRKPKKRIAKNEKRERQTKSIKLFPKVNTDTTPTEI